MKRKEIPLFSEMLTNLGAGNKTVPNTPLLILPVSDQKSTMYFTNCQFLKASEIISGSGNNLSSGTMTNLVIDN